MVVRNGLFEAMGPSGSLWLTFEWSGSEFSEEVSGRVMFLSMRPEVSAPVKTPQEEPAPMASKISYGPNRTPGDSGI